MQIKEVKKDGLSYEYEVTVPANDLDSRIDARLQEVGKTIRIQGFRPGKVPLNILKQRYGKSIMGEVLELTVNETSQKLLEDKDLRPAMQPKIEITNFKEDADLTYKMEFEVIPAFKLQDFKGLKLEKPVAKIGDDQVNEALETIATNNVGTTKVEGKRATKDGDTVKIDFDGRTADDNVHHDGMKAESHMLKLGAGQFIEGFEPQLVGKKAGDKVEVNVTFPAEYGAEHLAGRDAIFDVTIHEIHEEGKADINDELAKRLGLDDLAALKKAVEEQLNAEYDRQSKVLLKKALLDALDETYTFDLPESLLTAEYKSIIEQVKADRKQHGNADETITADEEKEYKSIAARRVRLGLVLSEIGNENNITVSDEELKQAVIKQAQQYPGQEMQVFEYFSKNKRALEGLRGPVFEEKTVDFILELASITEKSVSAEELASALQDDHDHDHDCGDEHCSHSSHKKKETKKATTKKKPAAKQSAEKTETKAKSTKKKAS